LKLSRDQIFGVQNYTWANLQSEHGSKVYVYRFTRKIPATGEYAKYGAFHTGEVPYAYDNLRFLNRVNRPWQQIDQELANIMSLYWANFAKTGDPNGSGLPQWPAYDTADKKIMMLSEKPHSEAIPDRESLDFLYKKASAKLNDK
jgi:para-nitrobenzyl esterase